MQINTCVLAGWLAASALLCGAEPPAVAKPSPVDARIATAQVNVKAKPEAATSYNELSAALLRKGRDSEDLAVFQEAESAVSRALQVSKDNYDARKLQVAVWLGEHEYAKALGQATQLNKKIPDDLVTWDSLAYANIALGNYAEAERDAQWVLNLRPGNTLGFETAAVMRELFGDVRGSIQFWDEANRRTSQSDVDEHAWLLTQKARLQVEAGILKDADQTMQQVLQIFPESVQAMGVEAQIRSAQGRFAEAAELLGRRYQEVKNARNLYAWAEALEKNGQKAEASAAFEQFRKQAEAEIHKPLNANLQLVEFRLNRENQPEAALTLAKEVSAERHDCATLQMLAWALYQNGQYAPAKEQMTLALAVGVRDPVYFCHAAQVAAKAGDAEAAAGYERELKTFAGSSCPNISASEARR